MSEKPILFSGAMVRAILDSRKTQTRRIVKHIPALGYPEDWCERAAGIVDMVGDYRRFCPYGQPGDRLWVRETWRPIMESWRSFVEYAAGGPTLDNVNRDLLVPLNRVALRFLGARKDRNSEAWHPSIHMPRWASRISLEVKAVRVERLRAIPWYDIKAEGVSCPEHDGPGVMCCSECDSLRSAFRSLWSGINGAESWQANPWVWVVEFARVQP